MKNLEIEKGDIISLGELTSIMNCENYDTDAAIRKENTCIDNFDGQEGNNVYFEIFDTSMLATNDITGEVYNQHLATVKIISIDVL
jgi:hypothetical protein